MRFPFALFALLYVPMAFGQGAPANSQDGGAASASSAAVAGASEATVEAGAQGLSAQDPRAQEIREVRAELAKLAARLDALERSGTVPAASASSVPAPTAVNTASAPASPAPGVNPAPVSGGATTTGAATTGTASGSAATTVAGNQSPPKPEGSGPGIVPTNLPGGATLNYTFDGYYEYNFNQPPGRVNDLRAYDVLSNTFSINQASIIFALDPDVENHRRYGVRLDLQFGQATETLQGNSANEPRPEIYRNIFQAYGTYVVPVGKGVNVDFGKWASSLGVEGNYTKDQTNYTRSFYFYYLPFYHAGVRASYQINNKLAVNYWIVNGANQSEPTNGFKDELFGFVLTPTKTLKWTSNYYLGQEHPDNAPATNCTVPVQPGLCVTPISPAPNGKLHIFDNYATLQVTPKLALTGEGDYVIEREWATAAPGESSAPSHVSGGVAYAQYQLNSRSSLAARGEYLSDRGGLFSNATQALKEGTGTYKYTVANGLDAFVELRRDWSNIPYFTTHNVGSPSNHQTTALLGLVWWYGGKQGAW